MTTILNLYGGPGTGKSTSAAYLYYRMKTAGLNSELVREYAKDWAWERRPITVYDQIYLMGKQVRRESFLYGKVDSIVTDSPVMLGIYYAQAHCPAEFADGIKASTMAFYHQAESDGHSHHHVLLRRSKPYNTAGRYQNEDQAKEIDTGLRTLLADMGVPFEESDTDDESLNRLLFKIMGV